MFNSSPPTTLRGWSNLKPDLQRFFRVAKPYANGVLKKHREKIAAATENNLPTNKLNGNKSPPSTAAPLSGICQSNKSNDSVSTTPQQTILSISAESKASSSEKNSLSKSSQRSAKKTPTLQDMFKKQQEAGGAQKRSTSSSSKTPKKVIQNINHTRK